MVKPAQIHPARRLVQLLGQPRTHRVQHFPVRDGTVVQAIPVQPVKHDRRDACRKRGIVHLRPGHVGRIEADVIPCSHPSPKTTPRCGYGQRDLNPHVFRHWNLNPERLPITPCPHEKIRECHILGLSSIIAFVFFASDKI